MLRFILPPKKKEDPLAKAVQRGRVKPGHKYVRRWWDAQGNRWRYEYFEPKSPEDHGGAEAFVDWAGRGKVGVAIEYDPKLKDELKALGGKWNPDAKLWVFDIPTYLDRVRPRLKHVVYSDLAYEEIQPRLAVRGEEEGEEGTPEPYPDGFPRLPASLREMVPRIPEESARLLRAEQLEDAQKVLERMKAKELFGREVPSGMVLANGTGTGKTYVYAAVVAAQAARGRHALIVVPNRDIAEQVEGVLRGFVTRGGALTRGLHYEIATYADLRDREKRAELRPWARELLILDEAHNAKRMFGSDASQQGQGVQELLREGGFSLWVTATPFDRPWEAKYLAFAGIHKVAKAEDFDSFIARYGVRVRKNRWGGKEYAFVGSTEDLKRLHEDLVKGGFLTKRLYRPEQPVSYEAPAVELDRESQALLEEVGRRFADARGLVKALGVNLQRAILERAKARAAIPLIRQEIEKGRSVAVFFEYLNEKVLDARELAEEALAEEDDGKSEVLREYEKRLQGMEIRLESPVEAIRQAFADLPGGVALYTGAQTEKQLREAKAAFNEGRSKLLLLTAAKGGTGLSFHDTKGGRPTTQIVLTPPWTATRLDQMLGRTVRVGMKSDVRILMPTAQTAVERGLAAIIGSRLKTLGYAVRGGEGGVSQDVLEAFEQGLFRLDPGKVEQMVAEVGQALPEPSPAPGKAQAARVQVASRSPGVQAPLLSLPALPTPLFPDLEGEPAPKPHKPKRARPTSKPRREGSTDSRTPLFPPDMPLYEMAKALGLRHGKRLVIPLDHLGRGPKSGPKR